MGLRKRIGTCRFRYRRCGGNGARARGRSGVHPYWRMMWRRVLLWTIVVGAIVLLAVWRVMG